MMMMMMSNRKETADEEIGHYLGQTLDNRQESRENCNLFVDKHRFIIAAPVDGEKMMSCLRQSNQTQQLQKNSHLQNQMRKQQLKVKKLLTSILLLPLICIFLLPSLRLVDPPKAKQNSNRSVNKNITTLWSNIDYFEIQQSSLPATELLVALLRLPFDRLRLTSGGLLVEATKDTLMSRQDLQEEETRMQLLAPGEQRAYMMGGGGGTGSGQPMMSRSAQRAEMAAASSGGGYGSSDTVQVAPGAAGGGGESPSSEYGMSSVDQAEGGGGGAMGTVEVADPASHMAANGGGSSGGLQTRGDLPSVRALNVKCEKNHMTVNIVFDRPFYGLVFSKGHYNDQKCVHLPANSGQTSINFDIHLGKCGMSSSDASGNPNALQMQQQLAATSGQQQQQSVQPNGLYIENTIIIQYDPQVQEIYDQARKLRCTWYDYYEKSVTFRPYNVDMLDAVTANFLGDNIQCWMQIQVGKGPWSSEVAGIVKIGQTMTMVLAIKDDENRFDMLVRNCVAHDGKHQPIQLVDEYGCVARPKIMAKFQKIRNFGQSATVVSYAHFQAFKFPDSMSVHFQCVIQVCRYECPEPVCGPTGSGLVAGGSGQVAGEQTVGSTATASGGDYTASGTEIVSSKEPMPMTHHHHHHSHPHAAGHYFMANNSMVASTSGGSHGNSVNLKLDESQGKVQVKLDTSMMAGGRQTVAGSGPLPPHLLHTAETGPAPVPPGYIPSRPSLNSNYYKPMITGAAAGSSTTSGQRGHLLSQGGASGSSSGSRQLSQVRSQLAPPSGRSNAHYSSQYSHQQQQQQQQQVAALPSQSIYATNRLGELPVASEESRKSPAGVESSTNLEPQHPSPLSLIAMPRGLRTSLRQRRSINETLHLFNNLHHNHKQTTTTTPDGTTRSARQTQESTAIKTQKTIQVVSPDDVAFSLLDDDDLNSEQAIRITTGSSQQRRLPLIEPINTVCLSATRLIVAILVTVVALAAGLVIVAYLVMKQRATTTTNEFDSTGGCGGGGGDKSSSLYSDHSAPIRYIAHHSPLPVAANCIQQQETYGISDGSDESANITTVGGLITLRQQEEIRQRNNYLARLYSQFAPANYWR